LRPEAREDDQLQTTESHTDCKAEEETLVRQCDTLQRTGSLQIVRDAGDLARTLLRKRDLIDDQPSLDERYLYKQHPEVKLAGADNVVKFSIKYHALKLFISMESGGTCRSPRLQLTWDPRYIGLVVEFKVLPKDTYDR